LSVGADCLATESRTLSKLLCQARQTPGLAPRFRWLCALVAALAAPGAFALNPAEKPANYIVTRWDAEDGLPQNSIRQIFQTRDGYLWIGTTQGLARFDGLTFTIFSYPATPGIPGNQITSFAETRDGSLWIGTADGLAQYHDGHFTAYGRAQGLKTEIINALCVAPDGSLWIGSREGITRWVDGKFVNDIDTSGYDTVGMRHIALDRHNTLWLSMGSETLHYADGKFTRFGRAEGLPAQALQMICEDAEGGLIAVTQNGLHRLEGDRFVPFEQNSSLFSPRVSTSLLDRAGNLWIGSVGGLDRFAAGKLVPYVDAYGNKLAGVDALFEDREGCLWVGSAAGLSRFTDRRGYTLGKEEGVLGTLGMAVLQSRDGSIWISSWAGGVARFQNDTVRQYAVGAPLSHESITAIYEAPDGTLWFGNRGSSLDRLDGDKVTTFVYQPGVVTSRPVSAIHVEPDGELLAGIVQRGLLQLRDGQLTPVPEAAALAAETVRTIHRTRDGRLLIGTSKGIFQRDSNRAWQPVTLPDLTQSPEVRAFLEDDKGVIWLATAGLGLIRWAPGHARAYGIREGMVDDTLFSVVDDGLGSLWVSSAHGMARVRKTELAELDRGAVARLNCLTLGRADGLQSGASPGSGNPAAVRLADGRLMTATSKGIAVVDPRSLQVNSQPPTVVIESVSADDQPLALAPGQAVSIPRGTNRLEIRYTALSLIAPQRLRFRYQLAGSDPGWIEAGRERSARYTHLAPGAYVFHVRACNNDGVWNDTGATLAVTLQPLFYQTLWFRLSAIALLGGALAGAIGLRLRQLKLREQALARANAELDRRVRERTAELAEASGLLKAMLDNSPDLIYFKDRASRFVRFSKSFFSRSGLTDPAMLRGKTDADFYAADHAQAAYADEQEIIRTGNPIIGQLEKETYPDGRVTWVLSTKMPWRDGAGAIVGTIGISKDITLLKQAEAKLEQLHQQLLEASRQAGMAEVATSVLHNVGNVLNSVNVSVTLVANQVRHTKGANVAKLAALFDQHKSDLVGFLTQDIRGQTIPAYLGTLTEALAAEQTTLIAELDHLRKNVEHINDIVAMQQANAHASGIIETVAIPDLLEEALHINADALARHDVATIRDYQARPVIATDKHKVMQILINLVRNAKLACVDSGRIDKQITARITSDDRSVKIAISDNGIGIPAENLTRIFNHGFTTRKHGHGFGLHSGANAAKELGGSLTVHSDGPGKGAVFTLEIPIAAPQPPAQNP
jgi:PAS domain S-box-containing protein